MTNELYNKMLSIKENIKRVEYIIEDLKYKNPIYIGKFESIMGGNSQFTGQTIDEHEKVELYRLYKQRLIDLNKEFEEL